MRIGAAPVVGEEGEDGPCEGYHRDDEQNQNVVGRQLVCIDVAIDEIAQHAHDGDEGEDFEEAQKDEAYREQRHFLLIVQLRRTAFGSNGRRKWTTARLLACLLACFLSVGIAKTQYWGKQTEREGKRKEAREDAVGLGSGATARLGLCIMTAAAYRCPGVMEDRGGGWAD